MSELTTQEKIEAWEKVLEYLLEECDCICNLALSLSSELRQYILEEMDAEGMRRGKPIYYSFWPLDASGMASRRAFIQGKIDELRKAL